VSLHDSKQESVVRIFVALPESCEVIYLITLHYAAQFFPYQECNKLNHSAKWEESVDSNLAEVGTCDHLNTDVD